ncbi:hypothetical protein B0H12DRAFT_1103263 [Mycena haematopus]|nr:hypothetical protein B0H12DRAFT_1103263 [Mycena haematopus]
MSRPIRHAHPALTPEQTLVPLQDRRGHPLFPWLPALESTEPSEMSGTESLLPDRGEEAGIVPQPTRPFPEFGLPLPAAQNQRREPAPFPMELGERHRLPNLKTANKVFFDDALASLKELSRTEYIPPALPTPPVSHRNLAVTTIDVDSVPPPASLVSTPPARFTPIVVDFEYPKLITPISPPVPRYESIVAVNLKNNATHSPGTNLTLILQLPYNPFASQIIAAMWDDRRIQAVTGKWDVSRIVFAYSRKLLSVNDPSYADLLSGFREVGGYLDIVRDDDIGGIEDKVVQQVMAPDAELAQLRDLYGVGSNAHVFSVYFFYMDQGSRATAADSPPLILRTLPARPSTLDTAAAPDIVVSSIGTAAMELERCFPQQILQYRAIDSSRLGQAYKKYTAVRLIRSMASQLGMIWPEAGVPKLPIILETGLRISVEDILKLSPNCPSLGTFQNHNIDYNVCRRAEQRLQQKHKDPSTPLTATEQATGTLLYILLDAPFLDPNPPLAPDSLYATSRAVTASISQVRQEANQVLA